MGVGTAGADYPNASRCFVHADFDAPDDFLCWNSQAPANAQKSIYADGRQAPFHVGGKASLFAERAG